MPQLINFSPPQIKNPKASYVASKLNLFYVHAQKANQLKKNQNKTKGTKTYARDDPERTATRIQQLRYRRVPTTKKCFIAYTMVVECIYTSGKMTTLAHGISKVMGRARDDDDHYSLSQFVVFRICLA